MMRGGLTALDLRITAEGYNFSLDAFGDPPLFFTEEPLLARFGGDFLFMMLFADMSVTTFSKLLKL